MMRDRGLLSMGPNFEKSWAGISGIPAAAVAGAGAGAANLAQVDPELARQSAHARAGVHLVDTRRGAVGAWTAAGDGGGARRDGRR